MMATSEDISKAARESGLQLRTGESDFLLARLTEKEVVACYVHADQLVKPDGGLMVEDLRVLATSDQLLAVTRKGAIKTRYNFTKFSYSNLTPRVAIRRTDGQFAKWYVGWEMTSGAMYAINVADEHFARTLYDCLGPAVTAYRFFEMGIPPDKQ